MTIGLHRLTKIVLRPLTGGACVLLAGKYWQVNIRRAHSTTVTALLRLHQNDFITTTSSKRYVLLLDRSGPTDEAV